MTQTSVDAEKALLQRPSPELTDKARAEFAQAMGKQATEVDFLNADWSRIMQRGGVASVSFGYWRATMGLSLEDIGINPETAAQREAILKVVKLPQGRLLVGSPGLSEVREIESKGRGLLRTYSRKTGLGRFVMLGEQDGLHPEAGWHLKEFTSGIEAIGREFYATIDNVVDNWQALETQTIGYWATLADELYADLQRAKKLPARTNLGIDDGDLYAVPSQAEWINWFLNKRVRPNMITAAEFKNRASFSWSFRPILPPQALIKAEAEATLDSAELQLRELFVAKAGDTIDTFYRDVLGELRERLLEATSSALQAMTKPSNSGKLPGPNQTALRSLIDYVQAVKVWPDRTLEQQLDEMRMALDLPADTRADPRVSEELQKMFRRIAAEAKLTLYELDRTDNLRSTRELGIPDDDGAELERVSGRRRRNLPVLSSSRDEPAILRSSRGRALS